MRNKVLTIAAISLGVLVTFHVALPWVNNAVAGPPAQGPGGDETQAVLDDGFWYQGRLTDGAGNPLANTTVNVTFRLYNVSSGGTALDSVVVTVNTDGDGLFNEEIDFDNLDLFNGQALYLGLQVQGEASEMTPRQYLRVVPYALSICPGAIIAVNHSSPSFNPVLEIRHDYSSNADLDALKAYSESYGEALEGHAQHGSGVYGDTNADVGGVVDNAGVRGVGLQNAPGVLGFGSGPGSNCYGGYFIASGRALYAKGGTGSWDALFDGSTGIYVNDDIAKGGTCSAAVETADDDVRKLYAIESPNVWFEDFGQAQLANGQATVTMEPLFLSTINTAVPYHVFLTPLGDCNGLYVTNKTATSFEVRELGGGTANVAFDYRIVALRKGYETVRMEPLTEGGKPREVGSPTPSGEPEPEDP